ncbi:unnamed protein product [Orchesella dallaii]|uniref:Uncharacterized protein n=1 Tax=Orchesella dallaii TaxID=48710 RepID=A0ABP1RMH4_9HEXA
MITKRIKNYLAFRLHLNKLSGFSMFHWDPEQNQIVLSSSRMYYAWLGTLAFVWCFFLPASIMLVTNFWKLRAEDIGHKRYEHQQVVVAFCVLCILLIIWISLIGTLLKEHLIDSKNLANECLRLDTKLSRMISKSTKFSSKFQFLIKICEWVAVLYSIASIVLPTLFALGMFHPIHPNRRILEDLFGVQIEFNLTNVCLNIAYFFFAISIANTGSAMFVIYYQVGFLCLTWCRSLTPVAISKFHFLERRIIYRTNELGFQSAQKIIFVYRFNCSELIDWTDGYPESNWDPILDYRINEKLFVAKSNWFRIQVIRNINTNSLQMATSIDAGAFVHTRAYLERRGPILLSTLPLNFLFVIEFMNQEDIRWDLYHLSYGKTLKTYHQKVTIYCKYIALARHLSEHEEVGIRRECD